jgi:methyl-accepting chemotaxis protein
MDKSTDTLLVVFIAVATVSILLQAGFAAATFVGARKAQKKIMELADDVRLHVLPVIMSSRELIQDVSPKLKSIAENLTATSATLRTKADQIGGFVGDVTGRAQAQASRVDSMVTGTLDQLTYAVQAIEQGIAAPVRQVSGILNGLRAGMDVMRKKTPDNHLDPEGDLFV